MIINLLRTNIVPVKNEFDQTRKCRKHSEYYLQGETNEREHRLGMVIRTDGRTATIRAWIPLSTSNHPYQLTASS